MRLLASLLAGTLIGAPALAQTDYTPRDVVEVQNADWTRDAVLYQLNTRQFTPEGTFKAAQKQLPRLAAMGVDIIWLMPIHPIGEAGRKGSLGSPYAVRDYRAVNPELGTEAEFRAFIDEAHRLGLHDRNGAAVQPIEGDQVSMPSRAQVVRAAVGAGLQLA